MRKRRDHAAYMVAHDMVNHLAAIIGNCELLIEKTEGGTEYARRLFLIRDIAQTAVKELAEHQRQLQAEMRMNRKAG